MQGDAQIERQYGPDAVIKIKGTREVVVQVPLVILKLRAPEFEKAMQKTSASQDSIHFMLNFIVKPEALKDVSVEKIAILYQFAHEIGATQFMRMAQDYILQQKIEWKDVAPLLKIYPLSQGPFKNTLNQIVFAQACLRVDKGRQAAIEAINRIREIDPAAFHRIRLSPILERMKRKNTDTPSQDYAIFSTLTFKKFFKLLVPEMKELDLQNCKIYPGLLNELALFFPHLDTLSIDCGKNQDNTISEISSFSALRHLKIYQPNQEAINACRNIPLRSLEFSGFSHADETLEPSTHRSLPISIL